MRTLDIGNSRQRPKDFPYHAARRTPILQNPFLGPPGGLSKRRMFQAAPIQHHSFALHENCISLTWDVPSAAKAVLQLLDLGQREPGPITVWQGYWYLTYGVIKIKNPSDESTTSAGTAHISWCRGLGSHTITSLLHSMRTSEVVSCAAWPVALLSP